LDGPPQLDQYLQEIGPDLSLAILSRPTVAWANYPMFRSLVPGTPLVYDTVDLHFLRERRQAGVSGSATLGQHSTHHHDMELALARLTDSTWVVSEVERSLLLAEDPSLDVEVVPNIHRDEAAGPGFEHREGLLFVGSYTHAPNEDAAVWLSREVLPLVHKALPDVPLYLAGSFPTEAVLALASPDVTVLGWVPDLADLYHQSRLFVAPLRFGAGMKGKVGESLAYGLPVVTTTVGAEGMDLVNRESAIIADDAQALADAVVEAYADVHLWQHLSQQGKTTIRRQFSPTSVAGQLDEILGRLTRLHAH
jgi:O-antigen biosynthesis protein